MEIVRLAQASDFETLWNQRVFFCALCPPTAVGTGGSTAILELNRPTRMILQAE
jgi:hypothetical protein